MEITQNLSNILNMYAMGIVSYDEMLSDKRNISEKWRQIMRNLVQYDSKEMSERQKEIQRLVLENGITYNVYGDPQGENRPWELNPLPFVIDENEWDTIEKGLIQRAELMNLILNDLYSERTLLSKGVMPTDLLYNLSGFVKQCVNTLDVTKNNLTIYAVDIARGPDKRWWVIKDSTQAPSGIGYALENRMTLGSVFPELMDNVQIRKISGFYQSLNETLYQLSSRKNENPRIALLTPGPYNETYFEHSYLSSFFRYVLVQGGDLLVQNGSVWLKTLKGLKRVDVLLRRVDDVFCDPLELLDYSQLGISGLLDAVRRKNISVVNPLGSGVLENPALISFLPGIAKHFLNESLILPSIATWWCGQKLERKYVLENIHQLVIKNIRFKSRQNTIFADSLSENQLKELKYNIIKNPEYYVAQEKVDFSTTPVWEGSRIEPRFSIVRCFVLCGQGKYTVMPGGLTRTVLQKGNLMVSNQMGGVSQDTFILAKKSDIATKLTVYSQDSEPISTDLDSIPSRLAENLYWTGRYALRALVSARYIRTALKCITEYGISENKDKELSLTIILQTLTQITMSYPGFLDEKNKEIFANPGKEIFSLIFDNNRSGGLFFTLSALKNSSDAVKNIWSTDTRRMIDVIENLRKNHNYIDYRHTREMIVFLDQIITKLIAFMALIKESVTREQGRILYDIGMRLEQAIHITSKIRSAFTSVNDETVENAVIEAVLISHESLNIFRNSYRLFKVQPFIELLLLDVNFPSSLAFQLDFLQKRIQFLPKKKKNYQLSEIEKFIVEAFTKLRLTDTAILCQIEENSIVRNNLEDFLSLQTDILFNISQELSKNFFVHTKGNQQFLSQTISI